MKRADTQNLIKFWIATAVVLVLLGSFHAFAKSDNACPYLMKDSMGGYYDYSSMYRDADIAVIGRISNVASQTSEQGLMTLDISQVLKGDETEKSLLIPYTHANPNSPTNSDLITPTTREYLFFLKRTSPKTATRILCPHQAANGWVEHTDLHFSEEYSVPLEQLKSFIASNKAVVPEP